ncbi:MAG TPA: hypothetical protein VMG12_42630 [Polyangiaceae bacterium]|nr:hypothetical protein [Polyangiaceae bacterium]
MVRALPSGAVQGRRARLLAIGLALASSAKVSPLAAREPEAEAASASAAPALVDASADVERSAELFREGRELLAQGSLEEACRRFDASLELRRSPGTLLNIGYCRAHAGDLLAALAAYQSAIELARQQPDRDKAELWSAAAQKEIDALLTRVAALSVRVSQADVAVRVDDRAVQAGGDAILLNPGEHRLQASAPGKRTLDLGIELSAGQRLTLTVPVLGDESTASAISGVPVSRMPASAAVPPAAALEPSRGFDGQWALLLGGGALFAAGAVLGVVVAREVGDADYGSPGETDRARHRALAADVLMGTGLVGIGVGIAWPWIAPDPPRSNPASFAPALTGLAGGCDRDRCGLDLAGAF